MFVKVVQLQLESISQNSAFGKKGHEQSTRSLLRGRSKLAMAIATIANLYYQF